MSTQQINIRIDVDLAAALDRVAREESLDRATANSRRSSAPQTRSRATASPPYASRPPTSAPDRSACPEGPSGSSPRPRRTSIRGGRTTTRT